MILTDKSYMSKRQSSRNKNTMQSSNQKNNLEVLCKPVSVNITKLSVSELDKLCKTNSHEAEAKDTLLQKKVQKRRIKGKKTLYPRRVKQNQTSDLNDSKNNYKSQSMSFCTKTRRNLSKKSDITNLLRNMKQPYVKLHRIDEVINKIAQSLIKAVSNKGCETNVHTNYVEKTETELNASVLQPLKLSSLNANVDECLQNHESQGLASDTYVDESKSITIIQTKNNEDESSNIEENSQNFANRDCKRKNNITYFSNNDSDSVCNSNSDLYETISRKRRKLYTNFEETVDVSVATDECNTIGTTCINESSMLQMESSQNLHHPDKLCNTLDERNLIMNKNVNTLLQCSNKSKDVSLKYEPDNVDQNIQEGNAFTCVPSECNIEDNIPVKVEDDITIIEESILTCTDIEEQVEKAFVSDKDLIHKYKLLKELKVFLIKLDSIRNFTGHKYLATEIEQLSEAHMNLLINSNCTNALQHPVLLNRTKTQESSKEPVIETPSNLVSLEDSPVKSKEPSILHQEGRSSTVEKARHNLTKHFEDSSEKISEQNTSIDHSKQESIPTIESTVPSSVQKSTDKTSMIKFTNAKSSLEKKLSHKISLLSNLKEHISTPKKKMFIDKIFEKSVSITGLRLNTKEDPTTCYSSIISPPKRNKPKDKEDKKSNFYKCIVCDLCFQDYSKLQLHLTTHTQKQNNTSESRSKDLNTSPEETEQITSRSDDNEINKDGTSTDIMNKKRKKKKCNMMPVCDNSNECSMCSKIFTSRSDLAAHIFLHTESELQRVYELKKQKMKISKGIEKEESKQVKAAKTVKVGNNTVDKTAHVTKEQKSDGLLIVQNSKIRVTDSTGSDEIHSKDVQLNLQTQIDTEKLNKENSGKKSFKICKCHNTPGTSDNCLQIEIVLLCHTCRILFRSMKCFETHYRLPEHATCNQNRLSSGRSPNLFCTTCGMIFSSVQDVRHHLELHARFKRNATLDFRCNICKVIFIGVGTLFYIHWSKHVKNPFWMASEQTFPKSAIINSRLRKVDNYKQNVTTLNDSMQDYIQVAEHICQNCKLPFLTADDLKSHVSRCLTVNSVEGTTATEDSNADIQNHLTIKIICSLCNNIYTKKTQFYQHIRDKHNFNSELQFVCKSLTNTKKVLICNVCMETAENLDTFQEHWLKHCVTHVYFTCTHCTKIYHNSLNSFIEHVKEHEVEMKDYVPSCTVSYQNTKFICKYCKIGFESSESLCIHNVTHKLTFPSINSESDNISNHESSATTSDVNHTSSSTKSKESIIEREQEKSLTILSQMAEKRKEVCPVINNDKEDLIRILEGSDDSDVELIIDIMEHPEEDNESYKRENAEKPTTSNINNVQPILPNTEERVGRGNSKQSIATNVKNVQNTKVHGTVSTEKQKDFVTIKSILTSKEKSPVKLSRGLIRVKTLAELTDSILCHVCGDSVHSSDNLVKHLESHNTSSQAVKESKTSMLLNQPTEIISRANNSMGSTAVHNRLVLQTNSNTSSQRTLTAKTTNMTPRVTLLTHQQLQKLQRAVKEKQPSNSAHHTNLPRNIAPASRYTPSTSTENNAHIPIKTIRRSNVPNVKKLYSVPMNYHNSISFFNKELCPSGVEYKYKCKFCDFCANNVSECLLHELPGTEFFCKKQNLRNAKLYVANANTDQSKQCQQTAVNQPRINCASPTVYQYPYVAATSTNNINEVNVQNQPTIAHQPMAGSPSNPLYYKNPGVSSSGMSIVINQTAPVAQNIPAIGILQQPVQQQMYRPQFYTESLPVMGTPYVQQPQNVVGFVRSNDVYQIANNATNSGEISTSYEVRLQQPQFICSYCPKTVSFLDEKQLQIHVETYHNFKCNVCGLRLYNYMDWNNHKDSHNSI
ncbi:PREDICTED: uncharacterized protein LOC108576369 [Habropoda laboriosa]|uniref:uncharacterized protein LOC108576369 n=1 Tax=Habropoda laboriosa TaxID=597456 RepID=UPI00083D658B|nr:PREDICTED: uncharacterized protein LOC108576369 [Habropoda laboriosa]